MKNKIEKHQLNIRHMSDVVCEYGCEVCLCHRSRIYMNIFDICSLRFSRLLNSILLFRVVSPKPLVAYHDTLKNRIYLGRP